MVGCNNRTISKTLLDVLQLIDDEVDTVFIHRADSDVVDGLTSIILYENVQISINGETEADTFDESYYFIGHVSTM